MGKSIRFNEQSDNAFRAALQSGLSANPCLECEGTGEVEAVDGHPNDPNARTYSDDCRACDGEGSGQCPSCSRLFAYVVAGDGRCSECIGEESVEQVEALEDAAEAAAEYLRLDLLQPGRAA